MKTKQTGFSLIELVIVIVILGLLAATAIPRFLNVTDDAEDASVDGVAGGLSTAVSFVRSQWEVDGRQNSSVILDGTSVSLDPRFGYPTGTSVTDVTAMTDASCQQVFNTVLQSAPRNVLYTQDARNQRYTVRVIDGAGGSANSITGTVVTGLDLCVYHQVASLVINQTTGVPTPTPDLSTAGAKGVVYNPGTGKVLSFTQTPFVP
ncbi:prepilin-type N-terminal cleavage/methylation domain-containing protein [Shewanella baltica]|uniref:MSHA pilin protein MshB n=1 Tax=Shewanella baltica (strain OS155 / ATCC BAA-1091) TaxID=325240 RepID=A3D987_SHEB5|nr:prepilin-type N-terminal cleavage/methylation domain-containing protein [Shewanella baltica]ABN63300.1 MSHA pilin protein MshB [Shewanella baltica OS155]ACK45048.1 MSHA pilin protein MshB [Shewanella baltica OS223]AEH15648.1 MSHA pilin protein MshB [Shewanella baltica OS117]MCS6115597.1 prepilin-type N-terminal cleavage/methylation domain-containing protein [Shewanella baltica]UVW65583.1 prepilin-type N-terminal cleavage/methylation domain-containing protein [Shewanella baltica]